MRYLAFLSLKKPNVSVRVDRLPQKPPELTNARLSRREAWNAQGLEPALVRNRPRCPQTRSHSLFDNFSFNLKLPNLVIIKKQLPNLSKNAFSYFDKLGSFCLSSLCRLKPIFPAVAAHTKAGKMGTLRLNALKTSFSYFDKLGSFCLSRLCLLKPIFPAVAAHTKAGKMGTLRLNALKTSFSYFDKLRSFCLSRLCRLKPIFPAVAAHTKAGKMGTLRLNALKTSFSYSDKLRSFCLSSLCRLKPIFPAVAAHTKAGYLYIYGCIYLYVLVWWWVISEARSLFRGDVDDVVLKMPNRTLRMSPSGLVSPSKCCTSNLKLLGTW